MRSSALHKIIIALTVLLLPLTGSAKFPGILQRYQLGYSFVMNSADYTSHLKYSIPGGENVDTTYSVKMNTKMAYGVTMGTYIPLKRLGRSSSLVLGIDYLYNIMVWGSTIPGASGDFDFSGFTAQMALPLGLDFKFGADAINVKNRRFCATLGVGVLPSYSLTALDNYNLDIDPQFNVAPFIKLEGGIFAGICMKVRTIVGFGEFNYMNISNNDGGIESATKLSGKTNVTVSLLFMPFSFTWKKEDWWNTY